MVLWGPPGSGKTTLARLLADRAAIAAFWEASERPQILLRGDPEWAGDARRFLHELGARVEAQAQGTQLALL